MPPYFFRAKIILGVDNVKRVFISHPYSDYPEINRIKVNTLCEALNKDPNLLPISPLHLFAYMDDDTKRNAILAACYDLIDICDEVWIYGDSNGTRAERDYAELKNKKVVLKKWI
jgi:hypothetical protein